MTKWLENLARRRPARWWRRQADRTEEMSVGELRRLRAEARAVRGEVDRLIAAADDRLGPPPVGSNAMPRTLGGDWAWRPAAWRARAWLPGMACAASGAELDGETALFHDGRGSEVIFRQARNRGDRDLSAYGVSVEALRFNGSFLSLVVRLPDDAAAALGPRAILRLEAVVECERPSGVVARLNLQHGPTTDRLTQDLGRDDGRRSAEFDLGQVSPGPRGIGHAWIDLFVEAPAANRVTFRDLTFGRRLRAEF